MSLYSEVEGELSFVRGEIFYKKDPNESALKENSKEADAVEESWKAEVYPNPTGGRVQISLNSNSDEIWGIELFTSTGSLAKRVEKINSSHSNYQTDWSELPAGLYLMRIIQGENVQTKRLVIQ